jgi:hypothetical protein
MDVLSNGAPYVLLMDLAPISGLGATTGCTGVALPASLLKIVFPWSQYYLCRTSSRVLLTLKSPDGRPCSSVNRSFTLRGRTVFLFLFARRQIPSGALVCKFSQRGISIGPSSFCMWGYEQQCLSIPGAVRSLFPPEWALRPGRSVVPFSGQLHLSRLQPQWLVPAWRLPASRLCGCGYPLLGKVVAEGYRRCFRHWWSSELNLYSCKRWIQRAVCPSRFLKLMSR